MIRSFSSVKAHPAGVLVVYLCRDPSAGHSEAPYGVHGDAKKSSPRNRLRHSYDPTSSEASIADVSNLVEASVILVFFVFLPSWRAD